MKGPPWIFLLQDQPELFLLPCDSLARKTHTCWCQAVPGQHGREGRAGSHQGAPCSGTEAGGGSRCVQYKANQGYSCVFFISGVVIKVSVGDVVGRVIRGDIECSNGYIHIIDTVLAQVRYEPLYSCITLFTGASCQHRGDPKPCYHSHTTMGLGSGVITSTAHDQAGSSWAVTL